MKISRYAARAAVAAVAAVTLGTGLAPAALASPATAKPGATTVCGSTCQDVWGPLFGPQYILNATNLGAIHPGALQGRKLNLRQGNTSAINEDFEVFRVGVLSQFCTASGGNGQAPATGYACLSLLPFSPRSPVFEVQFAPNSDETHFCAGALAATNNFKIRLRRCGTRLSFFIQDDLDAVETSGGVFVPLIFLADRASSHPLVATVLEFSTSPVKRLVIRRLDRTAAGDPVNAQLAHEPPTNGPFGS
jgi:hypothetical protein